MKRKVHEEAIAAGLFSVFGNLGFALSIVVFLLYSAGLLPSSVNPSEASMFWSEKASVFLEKTGLDFQPGWFFRLSDGYFSSTAAIAVLASSAVPVLAALVVYWIKKRDYIYGSMALFILIVIIFAIIV